MQSSVLVVEDDHAIRRLVRTLLIREHFDVAEAETGNQAIAKMRIRTYAAVVLDIMMRDGNGHDVLEALAHDRPNAKCVVVISAASPKDIAKVSTANVEAVLRKPFDVTEFVDAVRRCVEH